MKPRLLDYVVMGLCVALSLAALVLLAPHADTPYVRVTQGGKTLYYGRLDVDADVDFEGGTVCICNSEVRVLNSDCEDGLCMKGRASVYFPLICLPNRLCVTIEGEVSGLDGISS